MSKRPICPDCGEEMTKEKHQHVEGFWEYFWHCGCKVEEEEENE